MKQFLTCIVFVFSFWVANAQLPPQNPSEKQEKEGKAKPGKYKNKKGGADTAGLTSAQGQQVKDINRTYRDKIKAVKNEEGLSEQQQKEKVKSLNTERQNKIKELVGSDKYDKMKEDKDEWKEEQDEKKDELNENKKKKDKKDKTKKQKGNGHKHDQK